MAGNIPTAFKKMSWEDIVEEDVARLAQMDKAAAGRETEPDEQDRPRASVSEQVIKNERAGDSQHTRGCDQRREYRPRSSDSAHPMMYSQQTRRYDQKREDRTGFSAGARPKLAAYDIQQSRSYDPKREDRLGPLPTMDRPAYDRLQIRSYERRWEDRFGARPKMDRASYESLHSKSYDQRRDERPRSSAAEQRPMMDRPADDSQQSGACDKAEDRPAPSAAQQHPKKKWVPFPDFSERPATLQTPVAAFGSTKPRSLDLSISCKTPEAEKKWVPFPDFSERPATLHTPTGTVQGESESVPDPNIDAQETGTVPEDSGSVPDPNIDAQETGTVPEDSGSVPDPNIDAQETVTVPEKSGSIPDSNIDTQEAGTVPEKSGSIPDSNIDAQETGTVLEESGSVPDPNIDAQETGTVLEESGSVPDPNIDAQETRTVPGETGSIPDSNIYAQEPGTESESIPDSNVAVQGTGSESGSVPDSNIDAQETGTVPGETGSVPDSNIDAQEAGTASESVPDSNVAVQGTGSESESVPDSNIDAQEVRDKDEASSVAETKPQIEKGHGTQTPAPEVKKAEHQLTLKDTHFAWEAAEVSSMTILKGALTEFEAERNRLKIVVDNRKSYLEKVDEKLKEALVLFDSRQESAVREDKIGYWKIRGMMFMESARYVNHAIDAFSKAVKLEPSSSECWNNLGDCYCAIGDYAMSKKCFLTGLEQGKNIESLQNLSILARLKKPREPGDLLEGIKYAKEALSCDFNNSKSWTILANAYMAGFFASGQDEVYIKKALQAYNQAAEKGSSDDFEVRFNTFVALKYLERYQEALNTLMPALTLTDYEWRGAQEKFLALVDYLKRIQELVNKKGKNRKKKIADYIKILKTRKPSAEELQATSEPRMTGVVIWVLSSIEAYPLTLGILTDTEEVISVSIFNLNPNKGFKVGDVLNLPITSKTILDVHVCEHTFQFTKIRIVLPMDIIVNGKRISPIYLKPFEILSS